jgi:hypothetical protein
MNDEARVHSYTTPSDAELAKAFLESHDIAVRLEGDALSSSAFAVGPILGDTQIYVDEKDSERAQSLLMEYSERFHLENRKRVESINKLVTRACTASLIGYITVPVLVHAYSVWLLLQIDAKQIPSEKHYRYSLAWIANGLAFGALFLWVLLRTLQ